VNRFYDTEGDVSTQLAPWVSVRLGYDPSVSMFRLERALRFRSDIAGGDIVVPVEFFSDLASIPRIAWTVFADPDAPFIELGGWVHDYLYGRRGLLDDCHLAARGQLSRRECDAILAFEAMPELGATRFQQRAVYIALRLFGRAKWNKAKGA
jgi:hypothetical protein